MGQVLTTITVTNRIDRVLAERGFIPAGEIRSFTLDRVLVDTGATLLALPAFIIGQLGLSLLGETNVETAAGIRKGRIFQDIMLEVEGRQAVFDCLEIPEGVDIGLLSIPERQRLRVLPMNEEQTYLIA
jgi:predicted aspartyl protease